MKTPTVTLPSDRIVSNAFRDAGRSDVVKWDVFPIADGIRLRLTFESEGESGRHGVWLMADRGIEVNSVSGRSIDLWKDTAPGIVEFVPRTSDGRLHLYNIWDSGSGRNSQSWTSGMLVEEMTAGRRYRCNDIGLHGKFDDLIFSIERV
jgi:hypothetical protein